MLVLVGDDNNGLDVISDNREYEKSRSDFDISVSVCESIFETQRTGTYQFSHPAHGQIQPAGPELPSQQRVGGPQNYCPHLRRPRRPG